MPKKYISSDCKLLKMWKYWKLTAFSHFRPSSGELRLFGEILKNHQIFNNYSTSSIFSTNKDLKLDYFILGLTNAPENAKMSGSNIFVTLNVAHCSSHRFPLVYAFENTFIEEVDTMLTKIYYLYKKNTKRLRELCELSNMKSLSQSHPKQM